MFWFFFFFFQAEDGIRDVAVTGVQTCALPILGLIAGSAGSVAAALATDKRTTAQILTMASVPRSEERRVGKECRSRWWPYDLKKQLRPPFANSHKSPPSVNPSTRTLPN